MANRLNPRRKSTPVDDRYPVPIKKAQRFVNVKTYGAKGDGKTNDAGSVSSALAAKNPPKVQGGKGSGKQMTAAELADKLAPIFADLSARAAGKRWTPKQRKDWDKAANLLQKVRGRGRKDPLV